MFVNIHTVDELIYSEEYLVDGRLTKLFLYHLIAETRLSDQNLTEPYTEKKLNCFMN